MIELQHITKEFVMDDGKRHTVLQDINLEIHTGDFMCLLGPSGCGKSTLLRLVSGLDKSSSGTILINGKTIKEAKQNSAFVFQNYALFPWMTVLENVLFGLKLKGTGSKKQNEKQAMELLKFMKLNAYANSYITQLSGGMKQRVAIARALLVQPQILYMDEPFGALDTFTRIDLQDLLLQICEKKKMTVIFVTHDIEEAIYLGNRVALMNGNTGKIQNVLNIDKSITKDRSGEGFNQYRAQILREFNLCKYSNAEVEYYI